MNERTVFGIKVCLYNFENTQVLGKWEEFKNKVEKIGDLSKWFDFFATYCKVIYVINPKKNDQNIKFLLDEEKGIPDMMLRYDILGMQGQDNHVFVNVDITKTVDICFSTILHEMTHVFERRIAKSSTRDISETIYCALQKKERKIADEYVKFLKLPSVNRECIKKLKERSNQENNKILDIVESQLQFDNDKTLHHELLTYALELRIVETLEGNSFVSNTVETFSLTDALRIVQKNLEPKK